MKTSNTSEIQRVSESIIEFVRVRTSASSDASKMTGILPDIDPFLRSMSGFIDRQFFHDKKTDQFVDVVIWKSLERAEDASLAFWESKETAQLFRVVDPASILVIHPRVLRSLTYSKREVSYIEAVVFRCTHGLSREQFLEKFDAAETVFATVPGMVSHDLALAADGQWLHLLRWTDEKSHTTAMQTTPGKPPVSELFKHIDVKYMSMLSGKSLARK